MGNPRFSYGIQEHADGGSVLITRHEGEVVSRIWIDEQLTEELFQAITSTVDTLLQTKEEA